MSSSVFPIIIWFSITHSPRMSLCLSLAFGRNATGARCEGVAAAVLSPVCVVCDPVDEVRRHSAKYGWTIIKIFTQVPLEHSYDGVAIFPFLDNHRRALIQISGELLIPPFGIPQCRVRPLPSDLLIFKPFIVERRQAPMFSSKLQWNFIRSNLQMTNT